MNVKKKLHTLLLSICLLASCLFATSCLNSSTSPTIILQGMWINTTPLSSTQTPIEVGDTLRMLLALQGYGHQLHYVKVLVDREYFKDSLLSASDVEKFCTDMSMPKEGYFVFKEGVTDLFNVPFCLIPKKARENQKTPFEVQMIIENDTKVDNEFNPNYLRFHVLVSDSTVNK